MIRFRHVWMNAVTGIAILLVTMMGCASTPGERPRGSGIQYYGSWSGYQVPLRPQNPISQSEAKSRIAYYVAEYDQAGHLIRFDKILNGEMEWSDIYTYRDDGTLQLRKMVKSDGSITEQRFDESGQIIR